MLNPLRLKAETVFSWVIETVKEVKWESEKFFSLEQSIEDYYCNPQSQTLPCNLCLLTLRGSQSIQTEGKLTENVRVLKC